MSCDDFLSLYSDYLDERLPPAAAARLRAHAAACLRCARYDQVMRRGLELARAMPAVEPSHDFHARLQHRLLHVREEIGADGSPVGGGAAVSLALALLLAVAAWGPMLGGTDDSLETVGEAALVDPPAELPPTDRRIPEDAGWWQPASIATPPRDLTGVFPGPYSPLVVTPPTADYQSGIVRTVLSSYVGLD
jgi:hypothetical protein